LLLLEKLYRAGPRKYYQGIFLTFLL
jgi:hypothetical protein